MKKKTKKLKAFANVLFNVLSRLSFCAEGYAVGRSYFYLYWLDMTVNKQVILIFKYET